MKKRALSLLLATLMLLSSALLLTSCGGDAKPEEGTVTRMTVDINPSVEFMVDDQNKVVSVTAMNDDAAILIIDESFVGKSPEEAVELMLSVAKDTGYLIEGNVEAGENAVKISVSGDTKYAEQLLADVEKTTTEVLSSLNISGTVEKVEALGTEALRALAQSTTAYTEAELAAMDEAQLYSAIAEARAETALLLTEDMRTAYYAAKEHKISFAQSEQVAKVIESLGGLYTLVHTSYKSALDAYSTAIAQLDALRYDLLISPDSEYQKSLLALREAKVELLKQRSYTASLEINGEAYASASATLQLDEENYNNALAAYEALGAQANASIEAMILTLKQAEASLKGLESTLFDANIQARLTEKAGEMEANINAVKDGFFAEFEAAHTADIAAIEAALKEKKASLKASIEDKAQ